MSFYSVDNTEYYLLHAGCTDFSSNVSHVIWLSILHPIMFWMFKGTIKICMSVHFVSHCHRRNRFKHK